MARRTAPQDAPRRPPQVVISEEAHRYLRIKAAYAGVTLASALDDLIRTLERKNAKVENSSCGFECSELS